MRSATGTRSSFEKGLSIALQDAALMTPAGSPVQGESASRCTVSVTLNPVWMYGVAMKRL